MATHSRILAWEIPWTEEPAWLQSIVSQRAGYDLAIKQQVEVSYSWDTKCSKSQLGLKILFGVILIQIITI